MIIYPNHRDYRPKPILYYFKGNLILHSAIYLYFPHGVGKNQGPMETVRRTAVRALLLTPRQEILLMKIDNREGDWVGWITPGGGIEDGESEEQALGRELREELGLTQFDVKAEVWHRFHEFEWLGKLYKQKERFFLIPVESTFQPKPTLPLDEAELLIVEGFKWWKLKDILTTSEEFAPRQLGSELDSLLQNGNPPSPIDVGI